MRCGEAAIETSAKGCRCGNKDLSGRTAASPCDLAPCSLKTASSVMSKQPQPSPSPETSDLRNGVLLFSGVLGKRAEPCFLGPPFKEPPRCAQFERFGRRRRRWPQVVNVNNSALDRELRETLDSRSQIEFALYLIKERTSMSIKRFIAQEQEINCGTAATQSVSTSWFGRLSAEIVHRCRLALFAPTVQRSLAVERERRQIEREQMAEEYARGYLEGWHQCYSACLEAVEESVAENRDIWTAGEVLVGSRAN